MTKSDALKYLEYYLKDANTKLSMLKFGEVSSHSEEYLQGRIDTLAQAIRYINNIDS